MMIINPVVFYSFTAITGKSIFVIDISTFIVAVIIGQLSSHKLLTHKKISENLKRALSKGDIVYKVECSGEITNEEFGYYLGEIVNGICEWKHNICEENIRSTKGIINEKKIRVGA